MLDNKSNQVLKRANFAGNVDFKEGDHVQVRDYRLKVVTKHSGFSIWLSVIQRWHGRLTCSCVAQACRSDKALSLSGP